MHRCFACLTPLTELDDIHGATVPSPTVPAGFTSTGIITWEESASQSVVAVEGATAKASFVASTDYIIFTEPDTTTHAFWFDTTGGDSEPAGSVAADNSYAVDISGDTTAADVNATLVAAIVTADMGISPYDDTSNGFIIFRTVSTGDAANSWAIGEFVTDGGFYAFDAFGEEGTAFRGGVDNGAIIPDGGVVWADEIGDTTPTVLDFTVFANSELEFGLDLIGDPCYVTDAGTQGAQSQWDETVTQPASLTIPSGSSEAFDVSTLSLETGLLGVGLNVANVGRALETSIIIGSIGIAE